MRSRRSVFEEPDRIAPRADWAPNIVQGEGYDSDVGEGRLLWERVQAALDAPELWKKPTT